MIATEDWFWEGNVVDVLALHLEKIGWLINSKANTHSKERGVDIEATKDNVRLLIEVKGYPATTYRDPNRYSETKRTKPTTQAQHWYAQALLKALRLQTKYPDAFVALAFPDFARYHKLFEETKNGLEKLGVRIFMVNSDGVILELGKNKLLFT